MFSRRPSRVALVRDRCGLPHRTRRLRLLGCASLALRLPRREPPPSVASGDYSRREGTDD